MDSYTAIPDRGPGCGVLLKALPCLNPSPLYRPPDPQASDLWRLLDKHIDSFQQVYNERFQAKYGYWRGIVEQSAATFLKCGDLQEGFCLSSLPRLQAPTMQSMVPGLSPCPRSSVVSSA